MYPALDADGNIWFGEMNANRLARLDPRTGKLTTWAPPNGRGSVMGVVVDSQGAVWFAEQAANYIGRFTPATEQFRTYPLGRIGGQSAAPQYVAFDRNAMLWFTEVGGAGIGRLDPVSGAIRSYPIPAPSWSARSYPFSLAVAPTGIVWFGDLASGAIGRLDPATGAVTYTRLAQPGGVFSMTLAAGGRLWFTELGAGVLGMVDTRDGKLTELSVPLTLGPVVSLYGVTATRGGDIWFASAGANALVRYRPATREFAFFTLPQPGSVPYGVALDGNGRLWFTADAVPTNYVGALQLP